jgi:AraC-like DNA-binding protein
MLDVAIACGFKTQQHFARVFRSIEGVSPTEYRRQVSPRFALILLLGGQQQPTGRRFDLICHGFFESSSGRGCCA